MSLATIGPNGNPQVTAVLVALLDDGLIHTSLSWARQKYKNLVREPRCSLLAIDPQMPMRTIEVRADVELVDDPDKSWTKGFLGGAIEVDVIDGPDDRRSHVVLRPTKVNTTAPGDF